MSKKAPTLRNGNSNQSLEGLTQITVAGYKSISREQSIEIRPLTILAGANSSGKSSIMQPLLLMKQTLEAPYDPGALLLDGPNVKFKSADQLLSIAGKNRKSDSFLAGLKIGLEAAVRVYFSRLPQKGFEVQRMTWVDQYGETDLRPGMSETELYRWLPDSLKAAFDEYPHNQIAVARDRCFLRVDASFYLADFCLPASQVFAPQIRRLIHVPGLRGIPERSYPVTAVGPAFQGTFENYTASVIAQWQSDKDVAKLEKLEEELRLLGLTWKVEARSINDTEVEIQVGRLMRPAKGEAKDLVNIADVGFGVSQTLPVLVALQAAEPGQMVYLEQPELHLHPRAQTAMAEVLADAARRGVRVVAETHSDLLLLGVQTLVAEGRLAPELVKLHWFSRNAAGVTMVQSADLDEAGAYGDWPEDFDEVALTTESRYIDAAARRQQVH